VNLFIPILYICINGSCAFLQQITVYADEDECKQVVAEKKEWYLANTKATVDTTCIYAPAKVMEEDAKPKSKPKRRETI
jgi:hypothetical protein